MTAFFMLELYNTFMTIYLDLICIENFFEDFTLLFVTGKIAKFELKNFRLLASAAVGAIATVLQLILSSLHMALMSHLASKIIVEMAFQILVALLMIAIAFDVKNARGFIKLLTLFLLATFASGGIALVLQCLICKRVFTYRGRIVNSKFNVSLLAGLLAFAVLQIAFIFNKSLPSKRDLTYDLIVYVGGRKFRLKAFLDSGNTLSDPVSHRSVIVVDRSKLPPEIISSANYFVPFRTVGSSQALLPCILPDAVEVVDVFGSTHLISNVLLGLSPHKISSHYQALLGPSIFEPVHSPKNLVELRKI